MGDVTDFGGWRYPPCEGAPERGLWFRLSLEGGEWSPWARPEHFFDMTDPVWPMGDAADADPDDDGDELAWFLIERAIGSRDEEEGRPVFAGIEGAYNGRPVLKAEASIEWGDEQPEGDASPYASPVAASIRHAELIGAAKLWMAAAEGINFGMWMPKDRPEVVAEWPPIAVASDNGDEEDGGEEDV